MGPREFLNSVVGDNLAEFRNNGDDERCAFNAIASVDALAAHIYAWCAENAPHEVSGLRDDTEYRAKLAKANKDFELVRDVAKAQKHVVLKRGNPKVRSAKQVQKASVTKSLTWDQIDLGFDEVGLGWSGPPQVVIEVEEEVWPVELVLTGSLKFLVQEMDRLEIP